MEFFKKHPIVANILLIILISIILIFLGFWGLDLYTRHGKSVVVPDIKGMQIEEARLLLKKSNLRADIIDSVYSKDAVPGSILDVSPAVGEHVKPGRSIFITINPVNPPLRTIPNVVDMSARQARALLVSIGFEQVYEKLIPGDFIDLAKGIQDNKGKMLNAGERVTLQTPLYLLVVGVSATDSLLTNPTDLQLSDSVKNKKDVQPGDTINHVNDDESWW
ncbi:Serine/threonine-protein kinase PrkC [Porphyromonas macacae]|uniref:Serine/threonine-protein kinase PrkC n=1 Tax=Porphyromonas macacae TaxID=28115 RepID=A0A379E9P8_9PORP|nr:PASTA domain-containing protein [Porphyromonas macacae]SUB89395.1 Serine/threonine-protein kinase PrkC [Porphyromonas macacae]